MLRVATPSLLVVQYTVLPYFQPVKQLILIVVLQYGIGININDDSTPIELELASYVAVLRVER